MMATRSIRDEILLCLPHLRAFARSLAGNRDRADDLVQDAIVLALAAAEQFTPGTNFKAWIFTILRNRYFNELRKSKHIIEPLEAADVSALATAAHHDVGLVFDEFRGAFMTLAPSQREALILVAASGFSYEEAAKVCNCAIGTIKSRISRARRELLRLTDDDAARPAGRPPHRPALLSLGATAGGR
jgi:RNA polymerase sigma-70 factor (ECF subfamily)